MSTTQHNTINCPDCALSIARHLDCNVRIADWPYDCDAKRKNPNATVYVCDDHGAWWHS